MDVPPPPPVFRRHHHSRYDNVLHPPDFLPPPYDRRLPPPPPPPQPRPPHILLQPPPPLPHPPPVRHIAHPPLPPRCTFSPPPPPILDRSHLYDFDPPPKPYFHRTLLPPPRPPPPPPPPLPAPLPRENITLRIIRDYPERNPIFEDEIFHQRRVDNYIREVPGNWDRNLQFGARELHTRIPDIDIGDHDRYRDAFYQSHKLYRKRDDGERWNSVISDWGRDLYNRRDHDERRWDSDIVDRGRELYRERDFDERRWDDGVSDPGGELHWGRDDDERRWDAGVNDLGRELHWGRDDDDERRWDSSRSGGVLFRLGNREPEFVDDDMSSGRFSGRLGRGASKGEFNRSSNNKKRLQKKNTLHRIQTGKDCSRHSGGYKRQHFPKELSRGSFKGKGKGSERLQTRMKDKGEREQSPMELAISFKANALVAKAILAPSDQAVKSDVMSMSTNKRLVYNRPGSPSAKYSKDVALDVQPDSQKTSKDLLDKAAVSGSGSMAANDASDLGETALSNAQQKAEPAMVRRTRLSRLRKKRRVKQFTSEANLQMEKNSDDSTIAKDYIDSRSAVSQLNSDTALSKGNPSSGFLGVGGAVYTKADIGGDSRRHPVPKLKRKRSSLTTASSSLCVADNVNTECSGHAERSLTTAEDTNHVGQLRADDVACHAHKKFLANENTGHEDSVGFDQHVNSVDRFLCDRTFVLDAEKGAILSTDQYTRLGSAVVDDINEHPVLGGLMLLESSVKGPSKERFSIEGHDTAGLSRPQETRISEVHEDKYFSENNESISSLKCDYAVMQTPEDVTISDVGSKDAKSKDFVSDQVNVLQSGVDAKEFGSLECDAVADCSNVGSAIATSSGLGISSPNASGTNFLHNVNSVEGSLDVISNGEACLSIDCSPNIIRKRKARDAHMGLSGTETRVSVGTVRSLGGEVARHLAEDLVPAIKVGILGEKDSFKEDDSLKEGPVGVQDSIFEVDFGANGSLTGYRKKRKLSSPRSSLSSLSEDETLADGITTNPPIHDQQPTRLAEWGAEHREDTSSVSAAVNQFGTTDVDDKVGTDNFYIVNLDRNQADGNKSNGNDDLAFVAKGISLCTDRNGVCASNSGDQLLASGFDIRSCVSSPEELLAYSDLSFSGNTEASTYQSENEMICGSDNISSKKLVPADPNICCLGKSSEAAVINSQINADMPPSQLEETSQVIKKLSPLYGKLTWSRNQLTSAVPKVFPGHHPLNFSNSGKLYSTHATKSRTWRRTGNASVAVAEPKLRPSSVPQSNGTKAARTVESSYIRKGNSLVRNPSLSGVTPPGFHGSSCSTYRLTPCMDTMKNNQLSDRKIGDAEAPTLTRTEQVNTSELTKALTVNHSGRSQSCTACNLEESSLAGNPLGNGCPCKTLDALEDRIKSSPVSECQTDSVINSDSQRTLEEGNSEKKIMYVKRRSNQLVATSNSDDTSILGVDKNKASLSDGYYKSRQNQLVRASSENHVKKGNAKINARRLVSHLILPKTSTRRLSGFAKTHRYSKFSFVWKLHDVQSSEKDKNSLGPQKFWPHLFSSKRAACWRSLILGAKSNNSSFSTVSQKLLLSRKRGAIYTRSTHGYSLRMSKVLSIGGCSLKWSKSIERNSKKANEEATRAVAAAEKRKKEEKGAAPVASKSRNHVSRERIFRIGSERYKMDPTRRTLHRITEKEPPSSVPLQSEKNVKRSYIPRRLFIGNEEYVRIGNGNQLVRDPKKRTRVLASEKVRWSLRTARLRLARKRRYCQFFTRFGKCNKDNGKCPYIHDPSKIVVCTKFLTGSCSNPDCKLTHKVIPERMQDCSYFLKGLCSNENCPYRHVNVDPDSTVCESFLRGYCADGNECRKKHTYVCPAFEATGICPQASTCKLHHPKKKTEKKPTSEHKIVRGRYFDGGLIGIADCIEATTERLSAKGKVDIVCHEGKYPDYISLDVRDEEADDAMDSKRASDDILPDAQIAGVGELI